MRASIEQVAADRLGQLAREARLSGLLLSNGQRIIGESYGAVTMFGPSPGAGAFGRATLGAVSLLGGVGYARDRGGRVSLERAVTLALALRYVYDTGGAWHPWVEAGGWFIPGEKLRLSRTYANGAGRAIGVGDTEADSAYGYARLGVALVTPENGELSIAAEAGRERLKMDGYTEPLSSANPFEATFAAHIEHATVYRLRGQYTHMLAPGLEAAAWANVVWAHPTGGGILAAVPGIGTLTAIPGKRSWGEFGGRISYDLSPRVRLDLFAIGDTAERGIGDGWQGGAALRLGF